jgi:AcrR family transcriptional regulator
MLMFMQPLPGRRSRVTPEAPPASVTRSNAHADQRRRILRATGELVAEHGYGELTVELIVKRAHVSFKTFYKHYRGKKEAFVELFEMAFDSTEGKIRERLAAEPLPWPEQVVLAVRALFEEISQEPVLARAVMVESPTLGPAITERYEQGVNALAPLFRAGRELNERGGELPATIEDTLAGSVFWAAYQRLVIAEVEQLLDADLPVLVELILRTYLGPAEARRIALASEPEREPVLA